MSSDFKFVDKIPSQLAGDPPADPTGLLMIHSAGLKTRDGLDIMPVCKDRPGGGKLHILAIPRGECAIHQYATADVVCKGGDAGLTTLLRFLPWKSSRSGARRIVHAEQTAKAEMGSARKN